MTSLMTSSAAVADLAQQSAGGVLGALAFRASPTAARPPPVMALVTMAPMPSSACTVSVLALRRAGDDQQPHRVARRRASRPRRRRARRPARRCRSRRRASGGTPLCASASEIGCAGAGFGSGARRRLVAACPVTGGWCRLDQPPQIVDGVPGHQVVVEPGLVVGVGQLQVLDVGALGRPGSRPGRAPPSAPLGLRATSPSNARITRRPLSATSCQSASAILPPGAVGAAPVPHPGQRDDAQPVQRAAVGLLDALGDPQRHRSGRRASARRRAGRRGRCAAATGVSYLTGLPSRQPRVVGPVLVAPGRAVGAQQRHQQAGHVAARRAALTIFSSASRRLSVMVS